MDLSEKQNQEIALRRRYEEENPWYDKAGWNKVSVSSARELAVSMGIKNVSAFINQVPQMRTLLFLGKTDELDVLVKSFRDSKVNTYYPNSHSYMSATV